MVAHCGWNVCVNVCIWNSKMRMVLVDDWYDSQLVSDGRHCCSRVVMALRILDNHDLIEYQKRIVNILTLICLYIDNYMLIFYA